ncbi:MAG: response regulator [Candidatus Heimdallarchaeota archaeon]|nr:response regulator [Candidatus Heimdallarchaeota archaeon]
MVDIYIVEDDENLQELYTLFLTKMGHRIVGQSFNGEEALIDLYFNFSNNRPDILILDYHMPIKNGLELLEDLTKLEWINKTKILFISATNPAEINSYQIPITKHVSKPFKFGSLSQLINEAMNQDQMEINQQA